MPIPIILGIGAAIAAAGGIGAGAHGAKKMKDANDTLKLAKREHESDMERFKNKENSTNQVMDSLGKFELNISKDFDKFSDLIEKIQNRSDFKEIKKDNIKLPDIDLRELKEVSVGAGIILGGTTGAVAGTIGGGVGLLVGGVIFGITGSKLSDKADEAFSQMMKNKDKINKICKYLQELEDTASIHFKSLSKAKEKYEECFYRISYIVNNLRIVDYNKFSYEDKKTLENLSLLVKLLYDMCKINLVNKSNNDTEINTVNKNAVLRCKQDTEQMLSDKFK